MMLNKMTKVQLTQRIHELVRECDQQAARIRGSEMETHIARRECNEVTDRVNLRTQKALKQWRILCILLLGTCVALFIISLALLAAL